MGFYGLLVARADLVLGDLPRTLTHLSGQSVFALLFRAGQPRHSPTRMRTRADAPSNFHCPGDTWADLILMRLGCWWPDFNRLPSHHFEYAAAQSAPLCGLTSLAWVSGLPAQPDNRLHQQGYWLRSPPSVDSCASSCSTAVRYWQPIGFLAKFLMIWRPGHHPVKDGFRGFASICCRHCR